MIITLPDEMLVSPALIRLAERQQREIDYRLRRLDAYRQRLTDPKNEAIFERRREIHRRHQAGETYHDIGLSLGISPTRARELAEKWEGMAEFLAKNKDMIESWGRIYARI